MSLLSKGLSRLGANIGKVAPLAGKLGKLIPGVGTAIGVGSMAYEILKKKSPGAVGPTGTFGGGGDANVWGSQASVLSKLERGEPVSQNEMDVAFPGGLPGASTMGVGGAIGTIAGRAGGLIGRAARTPTGRALIGGAAGAIGWGLGERLLGGGGGMNGMLPSGYHYNKALKRYMIADAQGRDVQDPRDEPRVKNELVRNRHMNVLNPRALSRANTRIRGFAHVASGTLRQLGYSVSSTRRLKGGLKRRKSRR